MLVQNHSMQQLSQACSNSVRTFNSFLSSFFSGKAGTKLEHPVFDKNLFLTKKETPTSHLLELKPFTDKTIYSI